MESSFLFLHPYPHPFAHQMQQFMKWYTSCPCDYLVMIEKKSRRDLMCVGRYAAKVMRNERSEMEHNEAKCLQISHNKCASQRDAISPLYGNLMLSHSAGMHNTDKSIAGISKRFHFASLHYIFSAYLPTHIKFLTEFHRIFFGTTCISFPYF